MNTECISQVLECADALKEKLITYRRDFHKYAESAWTEFRTSSLIAGRLEALGYEIHYGQEIHSAQDRMGMPSPQVLENQYQRAIAQGADMNYLPEMRGGFTGVIGVIKNGDGPVIALRFDIDGVEMNESKQSGHRPFDEGFISVNPGATHSCGHDGHASIGLGVAEILMNHKAQIRGTIKLIFQAAEEGVRGAKSLVMAGVVDDVDYLLSAHLESGVKTGKLTCARSNFLATQKFDAEFVGAPAHAGGAPQKGKNALVAAATAVMNLYAIPRHSQGSTRINIGRLVAGTGRNVIAPKAYLAVETRGETTALSEYMYQQAIRIMKSAAKMHDCQLILKAMGEAKSGISDLILAQHIYDLSHKSHIFNEVYLESFTNLGSEDYTYMMARVQEKGGLATFLGLGADLGGWAHHTAEFDINEDALVNGVKVFALSTLSLLTNK